MRLRRLISIGLAVVAGACGGGGSDGPSGPPAVASVQISAIATSLEVGSTLTTTVTLTDASGKVVTGRTVTYQSSAATIATVDLAGTVTGVAPGAVSITATSEGKSGTLALTVTPVAVNSITIDQRSPSVKIGESTTLTAKTFDFLGREVTGRTITWSSAAASIATVTAAGAVTGVASGAVYIRAESEGKRDSVSLRVRSLIVPAITGSSPATWTPGITATIDGTNFATTPAGNTVFLNSTPVAVTAATATRLTITVPSSTQLPCSATGPVPLIVVVNGDSALGSAGLQVATSRTLALGESVLFTSQADLMCNEFSTTGGMYLITAFNYDNSPLVRTNFSVIGAATAGTAANVVAARVPAFGPLQGSPSVLPPEVERHMRRQQAHMARLEADRQLLASRRNPITRRRQRPLYDAQTGARLSRASGAAPVPNVGDMLSVRMRTNFSNFQTYETVRVRVVYVGPKIIMLEDSLAPLANTMDAEYQKMGQEFDSQMYGFLSSFGDPLAVDPLTDDNGHLIAVFSKRVNNYLNGQILGFVTICDFFDNTGPPEDICPSSNQGEYFYAIVPDPNATNGLNLALWQRFMRGTLIHEAKHITAYAERLSRDTEELEESWLEEATAQQASELWARSLYRVVWKDDAGWSDGPRCDYASTSGTCPDPVEGILGHFVWLYQYYENVERRSILSSASTDGSIYGSAWSFARWVTDAYSQDEALFLRSLVQVKNDHGISNIVNKSGANSFAELLGNWSLASLADNYPSAVVNDGKLQLESWNSRDLFSAMNQFLRFSNGQVAFPKVFPLTIRTVPFGTWTAASTDVVALPGGGFAAWELSGTQTKPQVIALRGEKGELPPPRIGLAIVRVK
jgi:uncharacterized protein YjdB